MKQAVIFLMGIFFVLFNASASAQNKKIKISKSSYTGTWALPCDNKGWWLSIDVRKDTIIMFECMDGIQFNGIRNYFSGDTLFSVSDDMGISVPGSEKNKKQSEPGYLLLKNYNTLSAGGDSANSIKRISSKPRKPERCGMN